MSWATFAKDALGKGETVQIKPRGHSMKGKVNDGDLVVVEPCDPAVLAVGDIVLVRVHGNDYLHLVKAMDKGRFQIGNNRGGVNGWVGPHAVYGRAIKVNETVLHKERSGPLPRPPIKMGIEYKIATGNLTADALDDLLRRAPFFARWEPMGQAYEYRAPDNTDIARMPNAHAHVGADGIVFVANGGDMAVATAVLAFLETAWGEAGERFALEEI